MVGPKGVGLWVNLSKVEASNALDREIEPVHNPRGAAARLIEGPLTVDLIPGEEHHRAHLIRDGVELLSLRVGKCPMTASRCVHWLHLSDQVGTDVSLDRKKSESVGLGSK